MTSIHSELEERQVAFAEAEARRLRKLAKAAEGSDVVRTEAAAAHEFLARVTPGSQFERESATFADMTDRLFFTPAGFHHMAALLEGWSRATQAGALAQPYEARFRIDAAGDLLEQAEFLLDEAGTHPAAAAILAGAALEEGLRSLCVSSSLPEPQRPSLSSYAPDAADGRHLQRP